MTVRAATGADLDAIRRLLREYVAWLKVDLSFQGFEEELAGLPGEYAPPSGRLLVAEDRAPELAPGITGCVALRRIDDETCEMKRLYVRPAFRGKGVGRLLVEGVTTEARSIGYERMRLDTVESSMQDAIALYRRLGFREIAPYRTNPIPGALYLELLL